VNTSYFAKSATHPGAVSIALSNPKNFMGREYKALAPNGWFLRKYKLDGDVDFYTEQYQAEVLDQLDPKEVLRDLGEDAVLLCWEKPGEFCHRHLVAQWLKEKLGIEIKEL
jgi:uncharacterized protein (DUF488 family)